MADSAERMQEQSAQVQTTAPVDPGEAKQAVKAAKSTLKEAKKAAKQAKKERKKAAKAQKKAAKAEKKAAKRAEKDRRRIAKKAQKAMKKAEKRGQTAPVTSEGGAFWQPVLEMAGQITETNRPPLSKKEQKSQRKAAKKAKKRSLKEQRAYQKAKLKRLEEGHLTIYEQFECSSFEELEELLLNASTREEKSFYRSIINLKLQIEQEKVIGEVLL